MTEPVGCVNCGRERPLVALGACSRCYGAKHKHGVFPPAELLRNPVAMVEAKTMLPRALLDLVDGLAAAAGVSRSTFLRQLIEADAERRTVPEAGTS